MFFVFLGLSFLIPVAAGTGNVCADVAGGKKAVSKHVETSTLSKGWNSFYSGSYASAYKQASSLLKSSREAVRVEALHLQARALWAMRTAPRRQRAKKMWASLRRASSLNSLKERLQIAEALQLSSRNDSNQEDKAITLLEGVLSRGYPDTCLAEAAVALAELHVRREDFVKAKRALDFAQKQFANPKLTAEIPTERLAPFKAAVQATLERLDYNQDPGRLEYEQARTLQKQGQFTQAIKAFARIVKDFDQTDFGPRSELCIVECLLAGKRMPQAMKRLEAFIDASPMGPWRGQAYVLYLDTLLEEKYDLIEAGKVARKAVDSIAAARSENSWQLVLYDLYLRAALVSYLQDDFPAAEKALQEANKAGKNLNEAQREGLNRLISTMKTKASLLPEDFSPSRMSGRTTSAKADGAEIVLSSAVLYSLADRADKTESLLSRVLPASYFPKKEEPSQAAQRRVACKPIHISFALYQAGRMYAERQEYEDARRLLTLSMKRWKKGSWHDATLFSLARIMEEQATAAQQAEDAESKASSKKAETKTERLVSRRNQESRKIWEELLGRKDQSPYNEYASYRNAMMLCENGSMRERQKALDGFLASYAKSSYAGRVYVKLIDISLEKMFDIAAAEKLSEATLAWADEKALPLQEKPQEEKKEKKSPAESSEPKEQKIASEDGIPAWSPARPRLTKEQLQQDIYSAYLRCGLVDFLAKRYEQANDRFEKAKAFTPPSGYLAVQGSVPTGIDRMLSAAKAGKPITPAEALEGDEKASLILQLADVHYTAGNYFRALRLSEIVLNAKDVKLSQEQQSWALLRRGRCRFCLEGKTRDPLAAMEDYMAAVTRAPRAPWAYRGLFLSGNILFNTKHDVKGAVELWRRMLREYPDSPEAHRAAYYIGVSYEVSKQRNKALAAYNDFLRSYPDSPFVSLVRDYHLRRLEKQSGRKTQRGNKQQGV
ncbi:MAG: tetratricopeptide repeat protein [Sedimentisphaerales bacterium]|nr:tetratricopeptide repeat protein [Sedimentisphaerales bacterium]